MTVTKKAASAGRMGGLLKASLAEPQGSHSPGTDFQRVAARFEKADQVGAGSSPTVSPSRPQGAGLTERALPPDAHAEMMIDIALIDDNPYNARQVYEDDVLRDRITSMASDKGQMDVVKVATSPTAPGRYVLIDGQYRKRGALSLGWHQLRCAVRHVSSSLDLYRLSFALNEEHAPQTVLDNALAWQKLLDDGLAADQAAITAVTGKKGPLVSKTLGLLELPNEVLDAFRDRPRKLSLEIGYELVLFLKERGPAATVALAGRVVTEDLSKRDIASLRKRAVANATRERSRQYKITGANGSQVGLIKDFDDGRIEVKARVSDPKKRAALIDELARRLQAELE